MTQPKKKSAKPPKQKSAKPPKQKAAKPPKQKAAKPPKKKSAKTPKKKSVGNAHQQPPDNGPIPPITLEHVKLSSLTAKSVADLVASLSGTRLGVTASYGQRCVLVALAFSSESRVLLIAMDDTSEPTKFQKQILRDELLCNPSLEKHGFFMERLAAALFLDFGLDIQNAFDLASSTAAYRAALARADAQDSSGESAVKFVFTEQATILPRQTGFALRAWACHVATQGVPDKPDPINTLAKDTEARST